MYIVSEAAPQTAVAAIELCACQSMYLSLSRLQADWRRVSNNAATEYLKRVMFVRHPLERLDAAWSMFRTLRARGLPAGGVLPRDIVKGAPGKAESEYREFVDFALTNDRIQWMPQVDLLADDNFNFTPNVIHRFEDISDVWRRYYGSQLPHENYFEHVAHSNYRLDEIVGKYNKDLDLWESV